MKFVTHPENARWLKDELESLYPDEMKESPYWREPIEIIACNECQKESPSGKYVLPDGSVVNEKDVYVHTRFIDYGPEDIPELLFRGVIRKEMRRHFYKLDMMGFSSHLMGTLPIPCPRNVILTTFS